MKKTTGFLFLLFASMILMFAVYDKVFAQDLADLFGVQVETKPAVEPKGKGLTADEFLSRLTGNKVTGMGKDITAKELFDQIPSENKKLICTLKCEFK